VTNTDEQPSRCMECAQD